MSSQPGSRPRSALVTTMEEVAPVLKQGEQYSFSSDVEYIKILTKWTTRQMGMVCDLEQMVFMFDERARFFEKLDSLNKVSKDESMILRREQHESGTGYFETLRIDFRLVNPSTSAIVIFLDGGPRHFQSLQAVNMECHRMQPNKTYNDYLPTEDDNENKKGPMFEVTGKARKNYMGLAMCVLYKDGWNRERELPIWGVKVFLEPLFVSTLKEKQDRCMQLIINAVPALEKFKPRLFSSVREICAALSSHSLPKLKKKFLRSEDGLPIGPFVDTLFKQLFETFPKITEESESMHAVAMLQEMFHQIDYNGDGTTNWDEFTTFCVSTGLNVTVNKKALDNGPDGQGLDQYVIEYGEEVLQRDRILSAYRMVSVMRYIPETRKIYIISEDADYVLMLDEKYRMHAQLYPNKIQIPGPGAVSSNSKNAAAAAAALAAAGGAPGGGNSGAPGGDNPGSSMTMSSAADTMNSAAEAMKNAMKGGSGPRVMVYDVCFLTGRDLIAFTSSDHSITVVREMTTMGANKTYFILHNKFFHTLLHLKLCWSQKFDLLCSTASDRVIYGWNIDTSQIVFQVSRHTDIITDFIAADHLDVFITSSMDKRIVLWSSTSRRVKGILLGHKRGVRSISMYENMLLSAGFECDARLWDLVSKDCIVILRGHRHPITAARLMCERAHSEKDYRAITVDESGEFRLWNIYVRERQSEPMIASTLQIFEMQNVEYPINQFRFLALPYNNKASTSYYSDIIACSTKLLHFVPEKNTKEFVPPTACVCNEASAIIVTAAGRSLMTYDLSSGTFASMFDHVTASDIFALCMDGERGRRMFLGTAKGELVLINTATGQFIDSLHYHNKEITDLVQRQKDGRNCVFSCGADGHVRMYEESGGRLTLNNSADNIFGENIGLIAIKSVPSLQVLVVASGHQTWGIFQETSLKKLMVFTEEEIIMAIDIIGASKDKEHEELISKWQRNPEAVTAMFQNGKNSFFAATSSNNNNSLSLDMGSQLKDHLLTLAVAMSSGIAIYTIDLVEQKGVKTFQLQHDWPIYITSLLYLKNPDMTAVNYSSVRAKQSTGEGIQIVAVTDEGKVVVWDVDNLRFNSEHIYRTYFKMLSEEDTRRSPKRRHNSNYGTHHNNNNHSHQQQHNHNHNQPNNGSAFEFPTLDAAPAGVLSNKSPSSKNLTGRNHSGQNMTAVNTNSSSNNNGQQPPSSSSIVRSWLEGSTTELLPVAATLLAAMSRKHGGNAANNNNSTTTPNSRRHSQHPNRQKQKTAPTNVAAADNNTENSNSGNSTKNGDSIVTNAAAKVRHASMSSTFGQYLLSSSIMLTGHYDTIPKVVALPTNSCLITVSHDGFHRLWNLDLELLGELPLPNITEQMKHLQMCNDVGTQWKFILERIPVTIQHQEIAQSIVRSIKATKQEKMLEYQRQQLSSANNNNSSNSGNNTAASGDNNGHKNSVAYQRRDAAQLNSAMIKNLSHHNQHLLVDDNSAVQYGMSSNHASDGLGSSAQDKLHQEHLLHQQAKALMLQEEAEQRALTRKTILTALAAPPVEVNINRPPLRLPTKEEKELIKMTMMAQMELAQHSVMTPVSPTNSHHNHNHNSHSNTINMTTTTTGKSFFSDTHYHAADNQDANHQNNSSSSAMLDSFVSISAADIQEDESKVLFPLGIGEAGMSVSKSTSFLPSQKSKLNNNNNNTKNSQTASPARHTTALLKKTSKNSNTGNVNSKNNTKNNAKQQKRGGNSNQMNAASSWSSASQFLEEENTATSNAAVRDEVLITAVPSSPPNQQQQQQNTTQKSPGKNVLLSPPPSPYHGKRSKSPTAKEIALLTATLHSSMQFHSNNAGDGNNNNGGEHNHGNDMCMSSFGLPSLWVVPGEKDIFGRMVPIGGATSLINNNNNNGDSTTANNSTTHGGNGGGKQKNKKAVAALNTPLPAQTIAPAFSEQSILALHRENMIDNEGMRILRQVGAKIDRVHVYDRSQPTLLIRNPAMSTSVTLPPLEQVKKTEILFGAQKDLYKNAERVLAEKHDMNKTSIRGAVAIARIEQNLRHVNSMIHLIAPPSHDEVILPKTADSGSGNGSGNGGNSNSGLDVMTEATSKGLLTKDNEDAMMKLRLSRSEKLVSLEAKLKFGRPLDKESISRWQQKMDNALDITADSLASKAQDNLRKRQRKKKETISPAMVATLEKKLSQAIKGKYFSRMSKLRKQQMLMEKHAKPANETGEITMPLNEMSNDDFDQNHAKKQQASLSLSSSSATPSHATTAHAAAANAANNNNTSNNTGGNGSSSSSSSNFVLPTAPSPQQQIARAASLISISSDDNNNNNNTNGNGNGNTYNNSNNDFDDVDGDLAAGIAALTANNKERKIINLTTRELLPYYKLETVIQFMDIFAKVDENFSGDLDVNEWIRLFTSLNESVPVQEARMIFMKIDKDGDGYLSMRELIPVVFGKATRIQQKKIIEFCEFELTKKIETETIPTVTYTELDFLFEAYDSENVGFVDVAIIRERIRKMALNEQQIFFFMELIADLEDDEMVNLLEFRRIFRIFTKNK